jgi:hypothetical protein
MLTNNSINSNKNDSPNKQKEENSTSETNKEYEPINILSENGDSIYSVSSTDEIKDERNGQIFVLMSEIIKIVNEELDKRLGSSLNNNDDENV